MTLLLAVVVIVGLILIGVPVAFAFGVGGLIMLSEYGDPTQLITVSYRTIDSFPLLAIPFFLLSGVLMQYGGVSRRLIQFVALFAGRIRGGMGATLVGASAIFGAISGSSVATVSAMGSIMAPEMEKRGYDRAYVGGLASVSGILGILIPPSIPMVVYGISANVSVGDMFVAGILPGVLLAALLIANNVIWARRQPGLDDRGAQLAASGDAGRAKLSLFGRAGRALGVVPALVLPFIILGGIYGGIFTPTEAGAVACVYALLIGVFVYRELGVTRVPRAMLDGMLATAPILLIIAVGGAFSRALTLSGMPIELTTWIAELGLSKLWFLVALNVFMLLVGCLVEENTAIIILTPLLVPIATQFDIDPVHLGVIMVLNLGLGLATPPMAPNAFVAAKACDVPFHRLLGTTVRFLVLAGLPCLIAVNLFPTLSLWHVG